MPRGEKLHSSIGKVFGDRLKAARTAAGLSREDLANKLSISIDTIKNWEQKYNLPRDEQLDELSDILNCDIGYLYGLYKEKTYELHQLSELLGLKEESIQTLLDMNAPEDWSFFDELANENCTIDSTENTVISNTAVTGMPSEIDLKCQYAIGCLLKSKDLLLAIYRYLSACTEIHTISFEHNVKLIKEALACSSGKELSPDAKILCKNLGIDYSKSGWKLQLRLLEYISVDSDEPIAGLQINDEDDLGIELIEQARLNAVSNKLMDLRKLCIKKGLCKEHVAGI